GLPFIASSYCLFVLSRYSASRFFSCSFTGVAVCRSIARIALCRRSWHSRRANASAARKSAAAIPLRAFNRHSPDDSRTGVNSSDFLASLEARRELRAATRTTGGPNGGRAVDPAIFLSFGTHSFCRLLLNA